MVSLSVGVEGVPVQGTLSQVIDNQQVRKILLDLKAYWTEKDKSENFLKSSHKDIHKSMNWVRLASEMLSLGSSAAPSMLSICGTVQSL